MTRYYPALLDQTLKQFFQCKMSDEQIAERMNLSWQTIRRHRERLGLGVPKNRGEYWKPPVEPVPPLTPEPNNPVVIAYQTLGKRLTEANGCFRLDGTPTRFFDVMKETNRVLVKHGREEIGPNQWRVQP